MNSPPEIVFPVEEDSEVLVTTSEFALSVRAQDDEDTVFFDWVPPPGVRVTPTFFSDDDRQYSEILLFAEDLAEGMEFYCFVDDGITPDVQVRRWIVRFP